jgi:transposase
LSTKIHATTDALGNPIGFFLTAGQACDLDGADQLLPTLEANTVLADKAYDADDRVIRPLQTAGKVAVIPPKRNRVVQREYDKDLYKARHRKLFSKTQAIQSYRDSLRQTCPEFSSRRSPRRCVYMAQLMTGPSLEHIFTRIWSVP